MPAERIARVQVTDLVRDDEKPDRRVQIYLACGYWYDVGLPLAEPVPDLVGTESSFHHTCGARPPEVKRVAEKKPYKKYKKVKDA